MRYVALLRGINVGGNNKIEMKALRAVFEDAGMSSVRTYINSGNVIFETEQDRSTVTAKLESAIRQGFGADVPVLVKDSGQMRAIVEAIPATWVNDGSMRCDVLFLWDDVDEPGVLDKLDFRPEYEDVRYTPGAVIWRVDRVNVTKSRLIRVVGTPLYKRMTIRNCNTARKLLVLMEQ